MKKYINSGNTNNVMRNYFLITLVFIFLILCSSNVFSITYFNSSTDYIYMTNASAWAYGGVVHGGWTWATAFNITTNGSALSYNQAKKYNFTSFNLSNDKFYELSFELLQLSDRWAHISLLDSSSLGFGFEIDNLTKYVRIQQINSTGSTSFGGVFPETVGNVSYINSNSYINFSLIFNQTHFKIYANNTNLTEFKSFGKTIKNLSKIDVFVQAFPVGINRTSIRNILLSPIGIFYTNLTINNFTLENNLIVNNSYLYFLLVLSNEKTNSNINTTMNLKNYWTNSIIQTFQQNNTLQPNFSIPYLANGVYTLEFYSNNNETNTTLISYTIIVNTPVTSSTTMYSLENLIQQTTPANNQIVGLSENINYYLSHPADCIITLNSVIIYQITNSLSYQTNTSFTIGSNTLQFYCYYDYNATIRYYDFEVVNFEVRNFTGSTTINLLVESTELDLEKESLYLVTPCLQTKIKGIDGQYGSVFNPNGVRIKKIDEQGYAQIVLPEGDYELCIFNGIINAPTSNLTTQYTVTEAYGQKPIGTLSVTNSTTQNYVIKDLKKNDVYDKYNILNPRLDIAWGVSWTTLVSGFLLFLIGIIAVGIGTRMPDGSKVVIIGILCIILSLGFSLGGLFFLIF